MFTHASGITSYTYTAQIGKSSRHTTTTNGSASEFFRISVFYDIKALKIITSNTAFHPSGVGKSSTGLSD